ncbi:MAG TPA: helix-hairpin-helix domain-containing protein [Kineosporiaceae bacterium]|nr:helix-hairpin-helix domain-containing protein [Kineosporiaceae bacterium]
MRHDDDSSTVQRVSRILDQARRTEAPAEEDAWPQEWPPGVADRPDPDDHRDGGFPLGAGARWQIPLPAALTAAVLALLIVGIAAVLLLRDGSPGTVVPPRSPGSLTGIPTELAGAAQAGGSTEPVAPSALTGSDGSDASTGDPVSPAGSGGTAAGPLRVYVVGQVRRPGVVSLAAGARVEDAVQAVGGATTKADLAVMNLARKVIDGERIVVPRPGEKVPTADPVADPGSAGSGATSAAGGQAAPGAPVDLNTATVAELDALPGVGPVIAGRIVAWRQENGRFASVDDLAEVQGIGEATLAKLRPLVRV